MSINNNIILNRFFTKNTFLDLINNYNNDTYHKILNKYLKDIDEKNNSYAVSEIYQYITNDYRNEYFYKNTLLNKLLLGRHSINTTTALTEVPVNKSKADFVLINGKAIVYEIKTELDSFERLESQLNSYYKGFNNVCVVTCESNFERISNRLKDSKVGICILTKKNTISTRRKPIEDNSKLEHLTMFKILRKNEYENILIKFFGKLPSVTPVNYYSECYKLFQSLDIEIAYKYMLEQLKKRNKIEIIEYMKYVPYELKFLIYFSGFRKNDYLKLKNFLEHKIGE